MTPSRLVPLAAALAAALAATPAGAQSLLELYESARAYDAAWQSARAQYDANLSRAEQARASILPQAQLSATAGRSSIEVKPPGAERYFGTQATTASASQPLYRPANWATYQQGKLQAELAQAQLTAATQDLILRVSQAYFDVLAAQDTLAFVRAQKTAVGEQLASAKRNFEVGTSTITDTREAQARFDLVTAQEIQAENDLRVRRLALDTLTGRSNAQPVPLATPLSVPAPEPASVEAWVEQAEASSPNILQARTNVDIATWETEKAKAGHKPTLDLTASYTTQRNINGTAASPADNRTNVGQAGITFTLPLFGGFATQNRIRETLSLEEKARADLEAARRNAAQATRTAYFGLVSGQGQVRALEAAEASSQSALEANRLGYQVGVRINIDVLNAQSQLFQTKRDLAQARYNVLIGQLRLRQANGTLVPEDLQRLNALLLK
ncbi:MAG TPA: TolC family outer membrane protein [Ramlibacter sp.]|jgi:outer membrane protein|uniref:TolC family outer membrane protein n=1 Tax=Ramlibacter sp. TaxID=1917967 RepID=UPI002D6B810E|nr:TolC family outer membrane protein [Ramlibacter sp.]HZY20194.1 TolC family outer membrane protein [Ramlibacter sp.]